MSQLDCMDMDRGRTVAVTESADVDFRTRTGRMRRARTRAKILSAAFQLIVEKGVGRVTVDDVREAAGLSRGSFYNYFQTYEDMLKEIASEVARQVNEEQSANFDAVADYAERTWCNLQYAIVRLSSDRACAEIFVRVTPLVGPLNEHMRQHSEQALARALKEGAVDVPSPGVALDLGYGLAATMTRRFLNAKLDAKELEAAGLMFLRAFGVPEAKAARIARRPLPKLPGTPLSEAIVNGPNQG
jgi:AcrR family transcriptional regulator